MDRTPPLCGDSLRSLGIRLGTVLLVSALSTACATTRPSAPAASSAETESATETVASAPASSVPVPTAPASGTSEIEQLRDEVSRLSAKVQTLESELSRAQTKPPADKTLAPPAIPTRAVGRMAAQQGGSEALPDSLPGDRESGLSRDEAVRAYRQAMILFRGRKFPEAMLAFSAFLERHGDHALAGNAQYYIGECYYQQGENRLAERELKRVEEAYPLSPMISFALARLTQVQETLNEDTDASSRRELLDRLFPNSPAQVLTARAPKLAAPAAETSERTAPNQDAAEEPAALPAESETSVPTAPALDGPPGDLNNESLEREMEQPS